MSTCWFIGTRWCVATHLALLGPRAAIEMLRYGPLAVRAYAPAADGSRNRGQARNVRSSASCNDVLGVPVVGEKQEAIRRRDWCAPVTNWSNSATTPPSPFGRRYQRPRPTEWIRGARNLVGERKGRKERGGLRRVRHGPVAMPVATFVCRHLRSYRRQPDRSICASTGVVRRARDRRVRVSPGRGVRDGVSRCAADCQRTR
jgi:hypothetical protein